MLESSREESSVGELLAELLKYPAGPAPVELAALPCRAPELAVLVLTLRRTTEMWDGTSEKLPGPAPVSSPVILTSVSQPVPPGSGSQNLVMCCLLGDFQLQISPTPTMYTIKYIYLS